MKPLRSIPFPAPKKASEFQLDGGQAVFAPHEIPMSSGSALLPESTLQRICVRLGNACARIHMHPVEHWDTLGQDGTVQGVMFCFMRTWQISASFVRHLERRLPSAYPWHLAVWQIVARGSETGRVLSLEDLETKILGIDGDTGGDIDLYANAARHLVLKAITDELEFQVNPDLHFPGLIALVAHRIRNLCPPEIVLEQFIAALGCRNVRVRASYAGRRKLGLVPSMLSHALPCRRKNPLGPIWGESGTILWLAMIGLSHPQECCLSIQRNLGISKRMCHQLNHLPPEALNRIATSLTMLREPEAIAIYFQTLSSWMGIVRNSMPSFERHSELMCCGLSELLDMTEVISQLTLLARKGEGSAIELDWYYTKPRSDWIASPPEKSVPLNVHLAVALQAIRVMARGFAQGACVIAVMELFHRIKNWLIWGNELAEESCLNQHDFNRFGEYAFEWHLRHVWLDLDSSEDNPPIDLDWPCSIAANLVEWKEAEQRLSKDSGWAIRPINSVIGLEIEGRAMHHCVSRYWERCRDNQSRIFSILRFGRRVATLELCPTIANDNSPQWRLNEIKGKRNGAFEPSRDGGEILCTLIDQLIDWVNNHPKTVDHHMLH